MRGLLPALFVLGVALPLVAQVDDDYVLSLTDAESAGDSVTVSVVLDFSDGSALVGYQWGVCHDEDVLDIEDEDIEAGADGEDISFTFESFYAEGGGWTIGALLNVITSERLEPANDVELYDATYEIIDLLADDTEVEFCDTLGSPAVAVALVTVGNSELLPETEAGTITIGVTSETFNFTIPAVEVEYSAGSGLATFTVSPTLVEDDESPGYPNDTHSFSMAIEHDSTYLDVVSVEEADIVSDLNDGSGADFFAASLFDDGFTLGVVYSFDDEEQVIQFEETEEIVTVTYDTVAEDLIDRTENLETSLAWSDSLGDPPTENTVVFNLSGDTSAVQLDDGLVTLVPNGEIFVRGDCNANGEYNIGDAFALLGTLFLSTGATACDDACDADDNGLLSIIDALYVLEDLFVDGGSPLAPYPDCGADPTDGDDLGCDTIDPCL